MPNGIGGELIRKQLLEKLLTPRPLSPEEEALLQEAIERGMGIAGAARMVNIPGRGMVRALGARKVPPISRAGAGILKQMETQFQPVERIPEQFAPGAFAFKPQFAPGAFIPIETAATGIPPFLRRLGIGAGIGAGLTGLIGLLQRLAQPTQPTQPTPPGEGGIPTLEETLAQLQAGGIQPPVSTGVASEQAQPAPGQAPEAPQMESKETIQRDVQGNITKRTRTETPIRQQQVPQFPGIDLAQLFGQFGVTPQQIGQAFQPVPEPQITPEQGRQALIQSLIAGPLASLTAGISGIRGPGITQAGIQAALGPPTRLEEAIETQRRAAREERIGRRELAGRLLSGGIDAAVSASTQQFLADREAARDEREAKRAIQDQQARLKEIMLRSALDQTQTNVLTQNAEIASLDRDLTSIRSDREEIVLSRLKDVEKQAALKRLEIREEGIRERKEQLYKTIKPDEMQVRVLMLREAANSGDMIAFRNRRDELVEIANISPVFLAKVEAAIRASDMVEQDKIDLIQNIRRKFRGR